ncbi:phosphonate ABC transporter permease [Natrialba magadii ATCC 43099]|uniref:Phosphonate ABC transporter permease n=2 Tax=Natrialba magadii (strain ATCC 43099 / DSM 3394 / CCM 3739 / CIP 104546 / IAM 13178 / JCM 8861 / NBRC 102185 / NCIMB 2190 / MS3) TaxID=547559 RepID=L9V877_NATMM|nr:phosphonate ABC transporter permease [Natrialba magadii ATCC 43099]
MDESSSDGRADAAADSVGQESGSMPQPDSTPESGPGTAEESVTVDGEFDQIQRRWRRRLLGRVTVVVSLLAVVLATARWMGFDLAYLYAHRDNLRDVLVEEMLAPRQLWAQLQGDAPTLVPATLETLAIAGVGTAIGLPFAVCFGLLAASNVTPRVVHAPVRLFLGGIRAVPSMVYALLFVILAGLGPVAGALAIAMGTIGDLGRLFADEMEEIDAAPVEAVASSGGGLLATTSAARLPQVATAYVAWVLFYLEINARKSSVLGIVGAGGIGYPLIMAFNARNYTRVMAAVVAILVLVVSVELVANRVRDVLDADRRSAQ